MDLSFPFPSFQAVQLQVQKVQNGTILLYNSGSGSFRANWLRVGGFGRGATRDMGWGPGAHGVEVKDIAL